jgi:hypothetical protein
VGAATDMTLPHPRFLPDRRAGGPVWDRFLVNCIREYQEQRHVPKSFNLTEDAFSKAESGMKINKIGDGSFDFDLHGPSIKKAGRIQSPAQHASVVKAGRSSAAKRKARATFGGLK